MLAAIYDFFFHRHKWQIIREGNLMMKDEQVGTFYDARCETCGAIKMKEFYKATGYVSVWEELVRRFPNGVRIVKEKV